MGYCGRGSSTLVRGTATQDTRTDCAKAEELIGIRPKLFMAAMAAGTRNTDIRAQKAHIRSQSKTPMQTVGAAMRKFVHICFGFVQHQQIYQPQSDAIQDWANDAVSADTAAVSDGLTAFRALRAELVSHLAIVTSSSRASVEHPQFQWVNIVLGNLKTAISGIYHAFKFAKYAPRFLANFQYRFNHRYDLRSILPQLLHDAAITRSRTEQDLTSC